MKSLIFNEQMLRAWIEGRKTVTRRLVKLPPDFDPTYACSAEMENPPVWFDFVDDTGALKRLKTPYRFGETVYIKETWAQDNTFEGGGIPRLGIFYGKGATWKAGNPDQSGPWKSPRFMPEWASRSHALIISVRPERIQEITEDEAIREGFIADPKETWWQGYCEDDYDEFGKDFRHDQFLGNEPPEWMIEPHKMMDRPWLRRTAKNLFISTWKILNLGSWIRNDWVWRIELRIEGDSE